MATPSENGLAEDPSERNDVPVYMICEPIGTFPEVALPSGYRLRAYRTGDEATWTSILRAAERFFEIEESLFRCEYGHDEEVLAQRMAFVVAPDGTDIATITAWWQDDWQSRGQWGQIHGVAVLPEHQRRGISKAMLTWAMQRLAAISPRAMLGTSTARVWAVKVYLDFGFVPDPAELDRPDIVAAWHTLQGAIQHPVLEEIMKVAAARL